MRVNLVVGEVLKARTENGVVLASAGLIVSPGALFWWENIKRRDNWPDISISTVRKGDYWVL